MITISDYMSLMNLWTIEDNISSINNSKINIVKHNNSYNGPLYDHTFFYHNTDVSLAITYTDTNYDGYNHYRYDDTIEFLFVHFSLANHNIMFKSDVNDLDYIIKMFYYITKIADSNSFRDCYDYVNAFKFILTEVYRKYDSYILYNDMSINDITSELLDYVDSLF